MNDSRLKSRRNAYFRRVFLLFTKLRKSEGKFYVFFTIEWVKKLEKMIEI